MRYFVFVSLDFFYANELLKQRPNLGDRPLVIVRDGLVLDACKVAKERGAKRGQKEKLARSLVEGVVSIPWKEELFEEASRSLLDRLVPYSDVIEPVSQHSAFVDLSAHPEPESIALSLAMAVMQNAAYDASIGVGSRKWLAELNVIHPTSTLESNHPERYLKPLSVSLLLPVSIETRQRLQFLGYSRIGDVQNVPLEILRKQFGREATLIYESCRGGHFEPVLPLYPETTIRADFKFDDAVDTVEPIEKALEVLASKVAVSLSNADGQGSELKVFIETEEGTHSVRERTFANPLHSKLSVHAALKLMFLEPLVTPVVSLRVFLPRVKKQLANQPAMVLTSDQRAKVNETSIERLGKLYGDGAIKKASELKPEWHTHFRHVWERSLGHG